MGTTNMKRSKGAPKQESSFRKNINPFFDTVPFEVEHEKVTLKIVGEKQDFAFAFTYLHKKQNTF